jgi:hypothetical protein
MSLRPGKKCQPCKGKGCASCNHRGWVIPLRKARKKVKAVSAKRAKEAPVYSAERKLFLLTHPFCKVLSAHGPCNKPASQVHHRLRRGRHFLDQSTWLAVCPACHEHIERNGEWAKQMGYTFSPLTQQPPLPDPSCIFLPQS